MISTVVKSVYVFMVCGSQYQVYQYQKWYKLETQSENMNFPNDGQGIIMLEWVMTYE